MFTLFLTVQVILCVCLVSFNITICHVMLYFKVSKDEYDDCKINDFRAPHLVSVINCTKATTQLMFTIWVTTFQAIPGVIDFRSGMKYYMICKYLQTIQTGKLTYCLYSICQFHCCNVQSLLIQFSAYWFECHV